MSQEQPGDDEQIRIDVQSEEETVIEIVELELIDGGLEDRIRENPKEVLTEIIEKNGFEVNNLIVDEGFIDELVRGMGKECVHFTQGRNDSTWVCMLF